MPGLDSSVVMVAGEGHYYTAPVDQAKPTSTARFAPTTPWAEIGHTSVDTPLQVSIDGGDKTVLASWQAKSLRTTYAAATKSLAFNLLQGDTPNLKLYYGSNAGSAADGSLQIPDNPQATEVALYVVIIDGAKKQDQYYPRVSILRADAETFDTGALTAYPVGATVLSSPTGKKVEISPVVDTSAG